MLAGGWGPIGRLRDVADGVLDVGHMALHAGRDVLAGGKPGARPEHAVQPQPFAQTAAVAKCILQLRMRLVKRDATFAHLDRRLAAILRRSSIRSIRGQKNE